MSQKTLSPKQRKAKKSLGTELTSRLQKFVTELKDTDDLKTRFTVRTVKLKLVPKNCANTAWLARNWRRTLRTISAV